MLKSQLMKKMAGILIFGIILISVCLFFLVKTGVGLRTQSLISPSETGPDLEKLAPAVFKRLFPALEEAQIMILGILPMTPESQKFFESFRDEYQKNFHQVVNVIEMGIGDLRACPKPCWILAPQSRANRLLGDLQVDQRISLTWVAFDHEPEIEIHCEQEKRLDFECLKSLSIHGARKKMKRNLRNFFMNSYNERDFFLFVQEPRQETLKVLHPVDE